MSDINQVTVEGVTYDIEDEVARQGITDLYTYIDSHSSVQSDWDQNDETAADYVKNRLAYSDEDWHSSPEVTLNLNNQDGSQGYSSGYYTATSLVIKAINTSLINTRFFDNLHSGEDLKITFDNQVYNATVGTSSSKPIIIRAYADNTSTGSVLLDLRTVGGLYGVMGYGDELNFMDSGNFNPVYISNGTHTISFQRNSRYVSKFLPKSYLQGRIILNGSSSGAEIFNYPNNIASGSYSHAEGRVTAASRYCSHAEGGNTTASGSYSHAEGYYTTVSGDYSHVEGSTTTASGQMSHAEGNDTTASERGSHVEGYCTNSTGDYSHVQGMYNVYQDSQGNTLQLADVVGNGVEYNLSNAYTLDWDGNGWFAGKVTVGAAPVNDMDVVTKKFLEDKIAALEARLEALENA